MSVAYYHDFFWGGGDTSEMAGPREVTLLYEGGLGRCIYIYIGQGMTNSDDVIVPPHHTPFNTDG